MLKSEVNALDPRRPHWVLAVEAPGRNWCAAPGCRAHARFLVDEISKAPSRSRFAVFGSRAECLTWVMAHRLELNAHMPGARMRPVPLADWLLGLG
ncbi:hypothetical protein [Polymorphobacter fuscus]|uniref:Uncharacterized protein n=1 Tax=Sandarakinorhabdus fusca TaxID=1439888 RepID=A0A7C9GPT3_9SPHN|nr:hypothetical protein [Polymorphobacter fuscus]KAB7647832.1 hypothetical protein F9290_07660 [Polymorphobacter fuscus]MQT17136.1 hypothetical protein [Polymorphobacter fuscus]NJC08871.1 hypothetical protein [Polymorphobacter fuscus]